MSSTTDDPFTTPKAAPPSGHQGIMDPPPLLALPPSSPTQVKRTLQYHLSEIQKRIEKTGQLSNDLVKQQTEIEARISELDESGDHVNDDLKKKLADLEKEYNEVGRETARAFLTNRVMAAGSSPGSNFPTTPTSLSSQGTNSPTKLSVPSRRQRNQPSKTHDLEFAAELGQGLLAEIRKLQGLLAERDESLKTVQIEKAKLEQHAQNIESRLKLLDDSESRYKEENWNLELMIQDLRTQQAEQKDTETKLQGQIAALALEKTAVIKELDEMRQQHSQLTKELEQKYTQHEVEISSLRKVIANGETDRITLQKKVDELKQDLEESHKISLRLRQMDNRSDGEDRRRDLLDLSAPNDDTPDHSPPTSPMKHTPRHSMLESETLKSSLHHAHRMITNLKSNIHREKTEKAELKRMLQDARDDLEKERSQNYSPASNTKRRRGGSIKKPLTKGNISLLGGARKSRDEISMIEPVMDDEWEETHDTAESITRGAPGAYISSGPVTDVEGDTAFETANERDTTDAFETAHERDVTETEAYRTGAESPINDNPTSADDLTETEYTARRSLRPKSSSISHKSLRPVRLSKLRNRSSSLASTASTEDESDERYRYTSPGIELDREDRATPDYGEDMATPIATSNPRLKLRINRARSRGSRVTSESSIFSNVFSAAGSSPPSVLDSPTGSAHRVPSGLGKSLFAELGESPGMVSPDDADDDEEEDEAGTPSRTTPPPKVEMVDYGIMTDEWAPEPIIQEVERIREVPFEVIKEVPFEVIKEVPFEVIKEVPFEVIKEVPVEVIKEVPVEVPTEVIKEVPVEVPVEVIKEVTVEVIKEVPVEVIKEVPAEVPAATLLPGKLPSLMSEIGVQSDREEEPAKMAMMDSGTQSVNNFAVAEIGTQSDEVAHKTLESGTQFDPELEIVQKASSLPMRSAATETEHRNLPVVQDAETQVDPIIRNVDVTATSRTSTDSAAFGKDDTSAMRSDDVAPMVRPTSNKYIPLTLSAIRSLSTSPIELPPSPPRSTLAMPVPIPVDASGSDEETMPRKVSETVEEAQRRPITPVSSVKGLFGTIFGTRRGPDSQSEAEPVEDGTKQVSFDDTEDEDTIRRKDSRSRPSIPIPMSDQVTQTDISHEFFDKEKQKASIVATNGAGIAGIGMAGMDRTKTPSLRSRTSQESMAKVKSGNYGEVNRAALATGIRRPSSSSSMREHHANHPPLPPDHRENIAAAQQKIASSHEPVVVGAMGPPPRPASASQRNKALRPQTPVQQSHIRNPDTPSSRASVTPKPRFSATRSEVSSPTSRRSSLSSFASEIDERFQIHTDGYPSHHDQPQTDPKMIQAITQTMIGEFLWKYTRNVGRDTMSQSRHRRFFWVHPYTRTLYWSDRDPTQAGGAELKAKSVAIEAVKVVTDDNPSPPGLHRKSLVIITPGRALKFTAPTGQRHETWFNALSYLLLRSGADIDETTGLNSEDIQDFSPGYATHSMRGAPSLSSYHSQTTRTSSPSRAQSSLSVRQRERERASGSMSRLSNMFRPSSAFGTLSSRNSRLNASIYTASEYHDSTEDLREEVEHGDHGPHMENVRACCEGKHDVGTIPRHTHKHTIGTRKQAGSQRVKTHNHNHSHG